MWSPSVEFCRCTENLLLPRDYGILIETRRSRTWASGITGSAAARVAESYSERFLAWAGQPLYARGATCAPEGLLDPLDDSHQNGGRAGQSAY